MYLKVPKLVAFVSIFIYLLDSATSGPFCEKLCGKSRLKRSPGPMVWPGSCCTNLCGYNNLQIPKFPNLIQILNKEQSPIPIVLVNKTIYVEERKTSDGTCPIDSPHRPCFRVEQPNICEDDSDCSGLGLKCCYDTCLADKVCKPVIRTKST